MMNNRLSENGGWADLEMDGPDQSIYYAFAGRCDWNLETPGNCVQIDTTCGKTSVTILDWPARRFRCHQTKRFERSPAVKLERSR